MIDIPSAKSLQEAHRNGDDTFAHVATGEVVVPTEITQNPKYAAIMEAVAAAIANEGGDPTSAVVGAPTGNYNPTTGHQEFFLDSLFSPVSFITGLAGIVGGAAAPNLNDAFGTDFFTPNISAGLGAGVGNYIATQDIGSAAGAGVGAGVGGYLSDEFRSEDDPAPSATASFGERATDLTRDIGIYAGSMLGSSFGSGLFGGGSGLPNANISTPSSTGVSIPASNGPGYSPTDGSGSGGGEDSTVPQGAGISSAMPGVTYHRAVRDRDTGDEYLTPVTDPGRYYRGFGGRVIRV